MVSIVRSKALPYEVCTYIHWAVGRNIRTSVDTRVFLNLLNVLNFGIYLMMYVTYMVSMCMYSVYYIV